MVLDLKKLKGIRPQMTDPIRNPKVIVPLEKEFKETYQIELSKSLIDLTKAMVDMKTK